MANTGIGAAVARKEDGRFLHGRGQFVGDIKLAGMLDAAFVRSPVAHGRIVSIDVPEQFHEAVFTAKDLTGLKTIRANSGLKGFKSSEQPPLASNKVRLVGELLAVCVGGNRALAEDVVDEVFANIEELEPVTDMLSARAPDVPLVHEEWGDNVFLETNVDTGVEAALASAPVKISRRLRMSRQCMAPLEGRGVVAEWNHRTQQLVVHTATQIPHIVRTGLAECLGLDESAVRVIAPDVGGGFGYKAILLPEELVVCWLAIHLHRPVRWLEDRREALTGGDRDVHVILYIAHNRRAIGEHGIFVEVRVELLKPATQCSRFCGVHLSMDLHTYIDVWTHGFTDCAAPSYGVLFHFSVCFVHPVPRSKSAEANRGEALFCCGYRASRKIVNRIAANVHVAADSVAGLAAHEFIYGDAQALALDVPQRDVDR